MRIKRWILLGVLGLSIFSAGLLLLAQKFQTLKLETINLRFGPTDGFLLMLAGLVTIIWALRRWMSILGSAVLPSYQDRQLVEVLYERRHLQQGLKVVTVGGGTGLSTLLRGLKAYSSNLVAVVTVSDDGGSSGRLVKELGVLPPGDIRNCLVALADDESLLSELFRFRFKEGGLEGHNFGNLFLTALTEVAGGDFEAAVKLSSQILATRGRVLPATLSSVTLCARYTDGSVVRGESAIPQKGLPIDRVYLDPAACKPPNEVLLAFADADAIVLGPGSLYTSIIPNLLVDGIAQAVSRSPALKIYVCNVMTQPGETDGMGAADHVQALLTHAGITLDYVVVNLGDPTRLLEKYRAEGQTPVEPQLDRLAELGVQAVGARLLNETEQVRHDPERLAHTIIDLIARTRSKESSKELGRRLRVVK